MKGKILSLIALIILVFLSLSGLTACNDDGTSQSNEQVFIVSKGSITSLTDYGKTLTEITIPEKIDKTTITSIGNKAFSNCGSLKSVVIPDSVISIGEYAFSYCTSLESVTIGSGVTTIEKFAFEECTSLKNIVIPNGVTNIGDNAFYYCTSLKNVELPSNLNSVGSSVFAGCTSLIYNIKDGLIYLGNSDNLRLYLVGVESKDIKSATIDKNCKVIGCYAFEGCESLESVTIGDMVTTIEKYAFSNCVSLVNVKLGSSVESIGIAAFSYCTSLESIIIPTSLTIFHDWAFHWCTSLDSIKYCGSRFEWEKITQGYRWDYTTTKYTKIYEYTEDDNDDNVE